MPPVTEPSQAAVDVGLSELATVLRRLLRSIGNLIPAFCEYLRIASVGGFIVLIVPMIRWGSNQVLLAAFLCVMVLMGATSIGPTPERGPSWWAHCWHDEGRNTGRPSLRARFWPIPFGASGVTVLLLAIRASDDAALTYGSLAVLLITVGAFAYGGSTARPWIVATALGACALVTLNTIAQRGDPAISAPPLSRFEHSITLGTVLLWLIAMAVSLMEITRKVSHPETTTSSTSRVIAGVGASLSWVLIAWTLRIAFVKPISDAVVLGVATSLFAGFTVWAFQQRQPAPQTTGPKPNPKPDNEQRPIVLVVARTETPFPMAPPNAPEFPEAVYLTLRIWRNFWTTRRSPPNSAR